MILEELQEIILSKLGNIITSDKAQKILTKLELHESRSPQEIFKSWRQSIDLPDWVKSEVTINETFFFRHPEQFSELKEKFAEKKELKILCAGVSSGEEAYSLAFLFKDMGIENFSILGIDIDPVSINKAKKARYTKHQVSRTPSSFKHITDKHLVLRATIDGEFFCVDDEIKSHIDFKEGNIMNFMFSKYDLIFARNILIYFNDTEKEKILKRLWNATLPGGLVYIGSAEVGHSKAA